MAITGNGTATSPYAVHSYYELKEVCNGDNYRRCDTDNIKYIRLDNNIDCNSREYGDDFEWGTIKIAGLVSQDGTVYQNGSFNINLDGHAIKNVMVKNSNYLFANTDNSSCGKIHSGQIRNIFGSSAKSIIRYAEFEDLSISVNLAGFTEDCFYFCRFNRCSTYAESAKLNSYFIRFQNYSSTPQLLNSDFYFKIDNVNNGEIVYNSYSNPSYAQVQSCRFRGEAYGLIGGQIYDMADCVFDIKCTTGQTLIPQRDSESKNALYNKDKMNSNQYSGIISADSTEMKNADTLTGKGFTVIDIKQSTT